MMHPMIRLLALTLLAVLPSFPAQAQKSSDRVAEVLKRLDVLGGNPLENWRFRFGDLKNGAVSDLDDSGWKLVSPEHQWRGTNANAWYRRWVKIPDHIEGFPVAGSRVTVGITADDYGEIWVNGKKRCDFEWDDGAVTLAEKARPGDRFLVAVRVKNRGGPGRLMKATLHSSIPEALGKRAAGYIEALRLARHIVNTLGGKEKQGLEHLTASIDALDMEALAAADTGKFLASLDSATAKLSGLKSLTGGYTVHAAGYSHIDLAWLWRWVESIRVCEETFRSALGFFEEFDDFRFSMSQSHAYRWMEKHHPELFARIRKAVAEGKWEIVGATSVETDCNLPGAESHIRQLLLGKRYFLEKFGKDVRIGWCPDSFGYNINLPQILKKAGVDYFVTAKISWNDTNPFPHNLFWWKAPDGSQVLTFLPMGGYTFDLNGLKIIDHLARIEKQVEGVKRIMSVYGVGNHGGGPTRAMLERGERLKRLDFYPEVKMTSALEFFTAFSKEELSRLPVWQSELYLEYHRGTYTTQAAVKKGNRKGECGLMTAEKLASVARLHGNDYPARRLEKAWDLLVFNQMHDILPGSSITPVYRDVRRDYGRMRGAYRRVTRESLEALGRSVNFRSPGQGKPVLVFNDLSWPRSGLVKVELEEDEAPGAGESWHMRNGANRNELLCQVIEDEEGRSLIFRAEDVPSVGYRTFTAYRDKTSPMADKKSSLRATATTLENAHLKVTLDPDTGNVVSLVHKATGREAVAEGGQANRLQLLEDRPKHYDAWNLGFTGKSWNLDKVKSMKCIESGPVRAVVRIERTFLGASKKRRHPTENFPSSFFTQDLILERGSPVLKVRLRADWWEDHICAKVAFPLSVDPKTCVYEAPYAHIERSTRRDTSWDKARYEVSAQKWADMATGGFGVAVLNDSKYGYDALHNCIRLTLLRSPTSPDPAADRGRHDTTYALYPHAGDWRESFTVRQGYELNYPLLVHRLTPTPGHRPARGMSFLSVDAPNVIVTVWKKHEDSGGHILRLYEWAGRPETRVTLSLPFPVKKAYTIDLIEKKKIPIPANGEKIAVTIGPYAIETLLVE